MKVRPFSAGPVRMVSFSYRRDFTDRILKEDKKNYYAQKVLREQMSLRKRWGVILEENENIYA